MKKSAFLKYAGILIALCSFVRFFFGLSMMNFFVAARSFGAIGDELLGLAGINLGLIVLSSLSYLISGFVGGLNWDEPLRAGRCAVWGGVSLALGLAGNAMQAVTGYGISYVAWITGAAVPAVFFASALGYYISVKKSKNV